MCNLAAARPKCSSSATAMKYSSWRNSTIIPSGRCPANRLTQLYTGRASVLVGAPKRYRPPTFCDGWRSVVCLVAVARAIPDRKRSRTRRRSPSEGSVVHREDRTRLHASPRLVYRSCTVNLNRDTAKLLLTTTRCTAQRTPAYEG